MLAGAVVVDLGDAVANGVAAFAAVVSVIALFTADSRAKEANSISTEANRTAREAREIAREANELTKKQHEYTVNADKEERQAQFRELALPVLNRFHAISDTFNSGLTIAGASELNLIGPELNKMRPLFPGDSLFHFNGYISDVRSALERYQLFNFEYHITGSYTKNETSEKLAREIFDLTRVSIVYIAGIFQSAFGGEYYLDWFSETDKVSRNFRQDLSDAYKAIQEYKIESKNLKDH